MVLSHGEGAPPFFGSMQLLFASGLLLAQESESERIYDVYLRNQRGR
jgi:hypothetical protein